jgi:CRP-like cAMP-binding protein
MLVIVKSVLALPLSGVLATSGVFAIVLGLALQNTLGDVFAGIAVGVESPFKVGDRIALADKLEGQVVQVNWRSVWIQTDDNDVAIIPHSLVAKNQIINRSFPSPRRSVSVELSCPKDALPDRVIDSLQWATWLCPAILRNPAPYAVLTRLGRRSHRYSVSFSVESTRGLASTKGMLLRHCQRQLYYAGLLSTSPVDMTQNETPRARLPLRAVALLHDLVLFESLQEKSLARLAEQVALITLDSGEVLFAEDSADATLYIVASGIVQLVRGLGSAAATTIGCIGAGDYVGEIGLLTGARHAATATALTPCRVYTLARGAIAPLLAENADLASAFDKSVRRGLSILDRDVSIRAADTRGATGSLLARIRGYFHLA